MIQKNPISGYDFDKDGVLKGFTETTERKTEFVLNY